MLSELKRRVLDANKALKESGLVVLTWGNASEIDREEGVVAIKPSGVPYEKLSEDGIVLVNLEGEVLEGKLRPSSDLPTHLEIYRNCSGIGGIVHTHSTFATAFAQAGRGIPPLGTTHADCFFGEVPCARMLNRKEVEEDYEGNTGKLIVNTFKGGDMLSVPGILLFGHGPFTWGRNAKEAVENAITLEEVAKMAYLTETLGGGERLPNYLLEKHHERKHGRNAYYGQKK